MVLLAPLGHPFLHLPEISSLWVSRVAGWIMREKGCTVWSSEAVIIPGMDQEVSSERLFIWLPPLLAD